ncbi:MAG: hypothetical protein JWP91_87 [Fibrobacteres bacterium]|nr:hypothetical protein [Fibrobacterota bacterium]
MFRKPGRYRLLLRTPDSLAVSDTLSLSIKAPSRSRDKKGFALISRDPGEYALAVYLEGGQQFKAGMGIMRELAGFPNAYRRVARFVLSSDWSQDFTDFQGPGSRRLDLGKALEYAQWNKLEGIYIPLRNAFRIRNAASLEAVRDSGSPVLAEARRKLDAFWSSLSPEESAWFSAF